MRQLLYFFLVILFIYSCKSEGQGREQKAKVLNNEAGKSFELNRQNKEKELAYYQIDNENAIPLDSNKINIELEDYHVENDFKVILKNKEFSLLVLFSYYDFGNYDEYIVTLDKKNKQISKLLVYYHTAPDGNVEKYEYSDFYLFKNTLDLDVFKVAVIENLETQKVIRRDTIKTSYRINELGQIKKK